jgi:hypothetical protein
LGTLFIGQLHTSVDRLQHNSGTIVAIIAEMVTEWLFIKSETGKHVRTFQMTKYSIPMQRACITSFYQVVCYPVQPNLKRKGDTNGASNNYIYAKVYRQSIGLSYWHLRVGG